MSPPPPLTLLLQLLSGAEELCLAGTSCALSPPPHPWQPITAGARRQRAVTVPVVEAGGLGRLRHTSEEPPPPPYH